MGRQQMQITRRGVTLGLSAMSLTACLPGGGGGGVAARPPEPAMQAVPNPGWDAWVQGFRARALGAGISGGTFDTAFRGAGFLPGVIERDRNQTEFTRTTEDYLSIAASDERLSKGRAAMARQAAVLQAVEARYGVEGHVVAAVWGLESFFGERRGSVPVISALSTLAYDGRRGAFMEQQLVAALKILQAGDTTAGQMVGSWAGAMGHTQFIPTSYLLFAVDFTGDGRRDIWSEDPTDSLASTAAYLARNGWRRGQPWGLEVTRPQGLVAPGRGAARGVADWRAAGVRAADGGAIPDAGAASLIAPAGPNGPAFLLFRNFSVILTYNNAENYALGVGHLSDRLAGKGPIRGTFPPDSNGLTKSDRQEIQRRLTAAGFDTEGADGVIGNRTRAAISAWQARRGLPVTGEPSLDLLQMLRGG
jgi:lytic murein transglycosylase